MGEGFAPVAGEKHERNDSEGQLQTQDHLTQNEHVSRLALAVDGGDDDRRNDGDEPGDEPAQPRTQANVQKTFHHDLARERAGER